MTNFSVSTIDYHTAGEPFRIVANPPVAIEGNTVAERRVFAMTTPTWTSCASYCASNLAAMRICLADSSHRPTMPVPTSECCSGTRTASPPRADTAPSHWACGPSTPDASRWIRPESPTLSSTCPLGGSPHACTPRTTTSPAYSFVNVPSYQLHKDVDVDTSRGRVVVDIVFGGAIYAHLKAASVGLEVAPENYSELIAIGREVKWALNATDYANHPVNDRLSGLLRNHSVR